MVPHKIIKLYLQVWYMSSKSFQAFSKLIQKVLDELIQYAYVVTALCLKMNISFNLIYVHISKIPWLWSYL